MSHPSEYGRLRFCPKCGLEKTKRDYSMAENGNAPDIKQRQVGAEYVCDSCGFGFWISKSRRVLLADRQFAHARRRAPVKFTEACVGSEVARQYLTATEPPRIKTMKERVLQRLGFTSKCKGCNHLEHDKGNCPDSVMSAGIRKKCPCRG